jgi:hypothetical protein
MDLFHLLSVAIVRKIPGGHGKNVREFREC